MINNNKLECEFLGKTITVEVGRVARQANGSALVRCGDTVVLVTAVASKEAREGINFFPLTVDYQEKFYAAGRIPGGFFKREAKPSSKATLTARLIDRPLRPLFPEGFRNDVHIVATTLSVDGENEPDIWALVGASCALQVSNIPFLGPLAAIRIGRVDGKWVCNPSPELQKQSDVEFLIAGNENAITMVEGGALEVPDEEVLEALMTAHEEMQPLIEFQKKMAKQFGQSKMEYIPLQLNETLRQKVRELSISKFKTILHLSEKKERGNRVSELKKEVLLAVTSDVSEEKEKVKREALEIFEEETVGYARGYTLQEKKRIDQRAYNEIRTIRAEAGALPRVHGSALFTRGETQALVVVTLGTGEDEQRIDSIDGESTQSFMLHYNFPPFSVGEVGFLRGPGRREIGHGALAERALKSILPPAEVFPYTIRVVSEILESNGSSSMASVCAGTLALMDAGVPIKAPVAGIAMGLIKEGDQVAILSDILGDEDGFGDMDFKVAGTSKGVTALQMDIKITGGVTREILERALAQAKEGRLYILEKMEEAISEARKELSPYAPRIHKMMVPKDKIRDVIGSGGKTIRGIIEQTGAKIDIDDSGEVNIASNDAEALEKAIKMVKDLTTDPEVGQVYSGVVKRIVDFGAFVEILPNRDGLLHISEINHRRIENISEVLQEGDSIEVKVLEVDRQGKIRLSRKALLEPPQGEEHRAAWKEGASPRSPRPHPRREGGYGGGHGERRDARKPRDGSDHKDHKRKPHS